MTVIMIFVIRKDKGQSVNFENIEQKTVIAVLVCGQVYPWPVTG